MVIGAGTGGMFAACAAAEAGAKVIVMEKYSRGGGIRDNIGSINSRLQQAAGCDVDAEELYTDMMRYAQGECNPLLHRIWGENSGEMVDWYQDRIEERGCQLFFEADFSHHDTRYKHYATGHIPSWPADAEFAGIEVDINGNDVLYDYAAKCGAEFIFSTPMVELAMDGDKVTGAIGKMKDDTFIQVNASRGPSSRRVGTAATLTC